MNMVLKIHGAPLSTCTKRVLAVCKEKNIPYELIPVDWAAAEHKSEKWLTRQPFGQVPYIDDDGFILYESRAIGRYLAAKYPNQGTPGLVPDVKSENYLQESAAFEQAASTEFSNFEPYFSGIAVEKVFKPMRGMVADEGRVKFLEDSIEGKLDGYERILAKQKYVAGDHITVADLFHLSYGAMVTGLGYDYLTNASRRPNVARWWADITGRESWKAIVAGA